MAIEVLGIDLSETAYQLHGVDHAGRAVLRKRLRRDEVVRFVAT